MDLCSFHCLYVSMTVFAVNWMDIGSVLRNNNLARNKQAASSVVIVSMFAVPARISAASGVSPPNPMS